MHIQWVSPFANWLGKAGFKKRLANNNYGIYMKVMQEQYLMTILVVSSSTVMAKQNLIIRATLHTLTQNASSGYIFLNAYFS